MEDVKLLKKIEIFRDLNAFELAKVGKLLKGRPFTSGGRVVAQGEEGDSLFIVKSGQVTVTSADGKGNERELAELGEGDHFGEVALIDRQPRSASVTARGEARLLEMTKKDLDELLSRDLDLAIKFYKAFAAALCKRLRNTNESLLLGRVEEA